MWALKPVESAKQLAVRLMGAEKAKSIVFKQVKSDKDFFELQSVKDKIVVSGNSANSMAVGLGHYLKYYCLTNISWDVDEKISLPATLPVVDKKIRRDARVNNRFFLNYCTFGYSMVWWQWREWERFIDWMAINGVNLPLAITGQESVWYRVWRQLGLEDEEIRSYFTGPAHLPWHRMINLDHWQGPLPMSWLEHQEKLKKQIVERERQLTMRPVLPAFSGHVPQVLNRVYPKAKISRMSSWGGFKDEYRSYFLDPMDSLYSVIQKAFLKEQTRLYGTDHVYGVDPFNEVDPPSWEPEFLDNAGRTIYSSIADIDPNAIWVQMTWLFYIDQSHWTKPRMEAFLKSVPKGKLILLDYFAENTEVWKRTDSYFGQDFIWCYLGNFGGNTMLAGNLRETGKRIENTISKAGSNMSGVGSTLEAFDCNPMMYEYVLEKAWTPLQTDDEWVASWADRRLGCKNEFNRQAWQILLDSVYTRSAALGQAPLVNARPSLKGHGNWTTNPAYHYNNEVLDDVWSKLLEACKATPDVTSAQTFDIINIGRQFISNQFMRQRDELVQAYDSKDMVTFDSIAQRMELSFTILENILVHHPYFSYDRWMKQASAFGTDEVSRQYFRQNARTLLTTWGESPQSLNDYASRTWAGLVSGYYRPRWSAFIEELRNSLKAGKPFEQKSFNEKMFRFEALPVDANREY